MVFIKGEIHRKWQKNIEKPEGCEEFGDCQFWNILIPACMLIRGRLIIRVKSPDNVSLDARLVYFPNKTQLRQWVPVKVDANVHEREILLMNHEQSSRLDLVFLAHF